MNIVKNKKKLSNILFIKSDENGKFYEFSKLNGETNKFYFEVNENNVPKLLKMEDFAEWANELKGFLEEWNTDDITKLKIEDKISNIENAIIKRILKNTVDKSI